ncbi:MAG: SGNH/GDSL hydrolase family protein [Pseudomonadota bacterium]
MAAAGLPSANAQTTSAVQPPALPMLNVLFFGNSHLIGHRIPVRVRRRLTKEYAGEREVVVKRVGFNGARLSQFVGRASVQDVLNERRWDVIVLQEATASFLTPGLRAQFHGALNWFVKTAPASARIVLFQTWPWRNDHLYFRKDLVGGPRNADHFWRIMTREYEMALRDHPVTIAPVGQCWLMSPEVNALYSGDGNHATRTGAVLITDILTRTITTGKPADC